MTYLRFHLVFNLPLLVILGAISGAEPWSVSETAAFGWVILAVMLFTVPWDNLAAKWGVWGFPREKYSLRLGYLPIEEYAFFILQSANVMLALRALFHLFPRWHTGREITPGLLTLILIATSVLPWLFILGQGIWWRRKAGPRVNYALHLVWFLPVIYVQWLVAPTLYVAHFRLLALVTFGFGVYYTLADLVAVRGGTWFFDEKQITGVKLGGILPWEEIAFFFVTSLLVAQSYLLLLPPENR